MADPLQRNILVLVIDRFRVDMLGAYGHPEAETPTFDRLATESLVFDFAFSETSELDTFYGAVWHADHPVRPAPRPSGSLSLMGHIQAAGYETVLITDDPHVAELDGTGSFNQTVVAPIGMDEESGGSVPSPAAVPLILSAADWANTRTRLPTDQGVARPWCLWIHIGALAQCWPRDRDRDALSYALDIEDLDQALAVPLAAFEENASWDSTLCIVAGGRGISLGEHASDTEDGLESADDFLLEENIHVPLMVRAGSSAAVPARSKCLVSVRDIAATLLDWCGLPAAGSGWERGMNLLSCLTREDAVTRDALLFANRTGEQGLRTDEWYLRIPVGEANGPPPDGEAGSVELYSKPDDRWDINEISARCEEVIAELLERRLQLLAELERDP